MKCLTCDTDIPIGSPAIRFYRGEEGYHQGQKEDASLKGEVMKCLTCGTDIPIGSVTPWYIICPSCSTNSKLMDEIRQVMERGRIEFESWCRMRLDFWYQYMKTNA